MYHSERIQSIQRSAVARQVRQADSWGFFNLLTAPALLDAVEQQLPAHRERLFPPTETLSMFLAQVLNDDRSCQAAVNEAAVKRLSGGLPACSTTTGAYCRARQRLPLEMVQALARATGQWIDGGIPEQWR